MARGARLMVPLAAVMLLMLAGATQVAVADSGPRLGVYVGAHNPAGVAEFEHWLGRNVDYVLDFVPANTWASISNGGRLGGWAPTKARPKVRRLVLGVPLIPDTGGSLAEGATGAYDRYYRALALRLVRLKLGNAILRLGWEFSANWYRWKVQSTEDAAVFVQYWRRIVTAMRRVAPQLQYDWNPAHGWTPFSLRLAYPGNAYVSYIGMDVYDQAWIPNKDDYLARWNDLVNGANGLAWHRNFAREKGKPMSFPEWGLAIREDGQGGGDDPYFIEQMHAWISSNRPAYHIYFNFDSPDGDHKLKADNFPNAGATFRSKFGSGS